MREETRSRKSDFTATWPMPLPYPEAWQVGPGWRRLDVDMPTARALNLVVGVLNWLEWGRPASVPDDAPRGPLRPDQKDTIERLAAATVAWHECPPLDLLDLGRTASKFEQVNRTIAELEALAHQIRLGLGSSYFPARGPGGDQRFEGSPDGDPGSLVVGRLRTAAPEVATDIIPSRLRFKGIPSFDPAGVLPPELRLLF